MNEVKYSNALKKQVILSAVAIGITAFFIYGFQPLNSIWKIGLLVISGVGILFVFVPLISKQGNINCPHCNAEIYELIEATKFQKLRVKFCPCCGGKIEI